MDNTLPGKYILKGKSPILCDNLLEWGEWIEGANRKVKFTKLKGCKVSTLFLGLDYSFAGGPPLLFETMVFGGPLDGSQHRYSTWEEAEEGHKKMVKTVKARK